jgi:hypothetical protein
MTSPCKHNNAGSSTHFSAMRAAVYGLAWRLPTLYRVSYQELYTGSYQAFLQQPSWKVAYYKLQKQSFLRLTPGANVI